jgi:hypothetical protein
MLENKAFLHDASLAINATLSNNEDAHDAIKVAGCIFDA